MAGAGSLLTAWSGCLRFTAENEEGNDSSTDLPTDNSSGQSRDNSADRAGGDGDTFDGDEFSVRLVDAWRVPASFIPEGRHNGNFAGFALDSFSLGEVSTGGELVWSSDPLDDAYGWRYEGGLTMDFDSEHAFYGTRQHESNHHAKVYAFSRDDGAQDWSHRTSATGDEPIIDLVRAGGGRVYYATGVSSGSGSEQNPTVRALDGSSGDVEWEYEFEDGFFAGLAYQDDRLYVQQWPSPFHVLDGRTGEQLETRPITVARRGVVRGGEILYLVGDQIQAYELGDDRLLYTEPTEREPDSYLAIDDGKLYAADDAGWVDAYDVSDGAHLWSTRLRGGVRERPAASNRYVWLVDEQYNIYALNQVVGEVAYRRETERAGRLVAIDDVLMLTEAGQGRAYTIEDR